jgi:hypothetical protein
LAEQRKLKNEELKKRVKLVTEAKAICNEDAQSQISSSSSKDANFFITGAKVKNKARFESKDKQLEAAAETLALMNNKEDYELEYD